MAKNKIPLLLSLIDQAYNKRSWHGPSLRSLLRGITAEQSGTVAVKGRKTIGDQVRHAAYWKYVALRRILGADKGTFPLPGTNWFDRPADAKSWKADRALLDSMHKQLRAAVAGLTDADLTRPIGRGLTLEDLIRGVAAHDLYHAGQISLLRRVVLGK